VLAALCQSGDMTPCPVVVVTGAVIDEGHRLMDAGAQDYIDKRWLNTNSLTRSIENAIDRYAMQRERKSIMSALTIAKADAEAANHAKSDFLVRMSHELRSPLNVILGFTQLLDTGEPKPTPAQKNNIKLILDAGWYLLELINEVLDLASINSGKISLTLENVTLNDLLSECQAMIGPQALAKGIKLHFPVLLAPCCVQADLTRTKQVLLNLLTNAIKYNRSAGIITVRLSEVAGHRVRVSVEDTGLGLSEEQLTQLFQPFNRLGQETCTTDGTGVGLVICKHLVELMGGRIGADSNVGMGSSFWFELQIL
jgi:signal transduction histidine kinase